MPPDDVVRPGGKDLSVTDHVEGERLVQRRSEEAPRGFWARAALVARASANLEPPAIEKPNRPRVFAKAPEPMTAEVMTIGRLFDGSFRFRLPCFQRSYAWRTENVARLLADLRLAALKDGPRRFYPLGRLMLARQPGSADVEIVDGHQRMVTLTMLFAVLRDLESDPVLADRLHRMILDETWPANDPRRFILSVKAHPATLFESVVQQRGTTDNDPDFAREELSETERNIVANRDCIRSELLAPGIGAPFRSELAKFLIDCCRFVTVIVDDADDAWTMLNTEQETRLAFNHADEAKSMILSAMPASNHASAGHLWESCESMLAPEDMYRLLGHIRALAWRGRAQSIRPVEAEIVERFALASDGLAFMADHMVPYATRMRDVRRRQVGRAGPERDAIARHIEYMTWVDPHSWMPAVLLWMKVRGSDAPDTLDFIWRLDRLVWLSKIAGVDPGVQETRLHHLLGEIEALRRPDAMSRLAVDHKLRADAISNMRSANLAAKHYAGNLLRRLSLILGAEPGPIIRDEVTIEHILPRNPHGCRAWLDIFRSPDGCKAHHQKLGNVVLLSGRENQQAGTLSWQEKRAILEQCDFALARGAARGSEWTPRTIGERTDRLISLLLADFGLPPLGKRE